MQERLHKYGLDVFYQQHIKPLPRSFRSFALWSYQQTAAVAGVEQALNNLYGAKKLLKHGHLLAANDYELCQYAKKCAEQAYNVASRQLIPEMALAALEAFCKSEGVEPPNDKLKEIGRRARMLCEKWWRRALRKSVAREVEKYAISLGMVSKKKCIYASDETVNRRLSQKMRNKEILKRTIATNELGQEFTLDELSALNVSNPAVRRTELMVRLAGFDAIALECGHVADFYTMTAPSKFHAVGHEGKPNRKYKGATPKETQQFIGKTWAQIRAYLAKRGVKVYGFRVAEAHHDGTPHWHMVLFYEKRFQKFIRSIIKSYFLGFRKPFLKHDGAGGFKVAKNTGLCLLDYAGGEFGASRVRTTVQMIDRAKGSAVGYLAKYISKNIDGHGMDGGEDYEGGEVKDNVNRVEAWASCWGIRQFQQIGGAPVGVWRECRRMDADETGGGVYDLVNACDAGDWKRYTELQGGAFVARKNLTARVWRQKVGAIVQQSIAFESGLLTQGIGGRRSMYDNEPLCVVMGVSAYGVNFKSRSHEWTIKAGEIKQPVDMGRVLKSGFTRAWSSVNNCNKEINGGEKTKPFKRPKFLFLREKMPRIFGVEYKTGILNSETIRQFDEKGYRYG